VGEGIITGSAPPTASAGNAEGSPTGWTIAVTAGHLIECEVTARTGSVPRITLQLQATQA
jgi:hypothetical protein